MEGPTKENSLFPTLFGSPCLYCYQTSIYYGLKQTLESWLRYSVRSVLCAFTLNFLVCFKVITLLPNLYYGPKQSLEQWLRYSVDSVLCVFKSNCKVREM
jgi:hypothetical protein